MDKFAVQLKVMNFRCAGFLLLVAIGVTGCQSNTGPVVDFIVTPLSGGGEIRLSKDYKDKPVVVYMWATWCGPCKQFEPTLNKMAEKYQAKGITFLAISGEKVPLIRESELKEPHKMTVLVDSLSSAADAVGANALPTIVILDKQHHPIWTSQGVGPATESEMTTALDGLS